MKAHRIHAFVHQATIDRLDRIERDLGCASRSEAVRRLASIHSQILDAIAEGGRLEIVDADGARTAVLIF